MNIAVFASHNGSDLQAIIDACQSGALNASVCAVLSNNSDSRALWRAEEAGISGYHVSKATVRRTPEALDLAINDILGMHHTDMVFLAGYLKKIGIPVLRRYRNRIFNIHPSLLPKYGGKGMYGLRVHQAVIEAGDVVSGITIHRVNEEYDKGEIVAQTTVPVAPGETAESLAAKVLEREHTFIVEVIRDIVAGKIALGHICGAGANL